MAGLEYFGINPPFMEPEHRVLPRLVRVGDTVLDIGANVGAYTCQLSRLVGPSGRVVAFEPYPPSFYHLATLVRFLALTNVTVRNVAITDTHREVRLARPKSALGGTLHGFVHETADQSPLDVEVEGRALDEEVEELGLQKVNFIKCDVEGGESAVIAGGRRTLESHRPILMCEIEDRWAGRYGRSRSQMIEHLCQLGNYQVFSAFGSSLVPWRSGPSSGNMIFIPSS